LHLCDSLFPIGGFGHSDGLEAATAGGLVQTPADLQAWLDVCLDEAVGRMDGPAALCAWAAFDREDWEALRQLDEELTAMRPAAATRGSSSAMGRRLVAA
jgi:urease accessory protein